MTEHRAERPQRLVTACAFLGVIGMFWVGKVIFVLTGWYSASEDQVKRFTDPLVDEGFNRGDAETVYRIYLGILAILAASVLVFAVYTALGHAVSRIMVTITAPLMALFGTGDGTFIEIPMGLIAIWCVALLWTPDVRQWFALISGKAQPAPVAPSGWPPPLPEPPAENAQAGPPDAGNPQAAQWQAHPQPPQAYAPPAPRDWGKILTFVTLLGSSVVALGCGIYLVMYELAREELVKAYVKELDSGANWMNLTEAEVRDGFRGLAVLSWGVLVLCLVAIGVSTVLLWRRRRRN
jgi:hypothetical protein